MDKFKADKIINEYLKRIYGFAVSKTFSLDEAEELSSKIVFEVYRSLLKQDNITNTDGYVWRISQNVFAHFVRDKNNAVSVCGTEFEHIHDEADITQKLLEDETFGLLRREITYLTKRQREIIVLHYFGNKKIREISDLLDIPENTVKWHLACSRKELKTNMAKTRITGELGTQPIRLIHLGHNGSIGEKGDTGTFLAKSLTQNIAYAAYHQPRNINEIADELGVNPIFVKDDIDVLEEYGFMDKLPDGRYRTNILITIPSKEAYEIHQRTASKYAELFAERFFKPLIDDITEIPDWLNVPDNDLNLLKWLMTFMIQDRLYAGDFDFERFSVKRPDGGDYIAHAELATENTDTLSQDKYEKYRFCGHMAISFDYNDTEISSWQLNCRFTDRFFGWQDNLSSDYQKLYFWLNGELEDKPSNAESYQRLLDKGYLLKTENGYKCNVIYCRNKDKWESFLPNIPPEITRLAEEYGKEWAKASIIGQPKHMHALINEQSKTAATSLHTRIAENLYESGVLKEPTAEQKKGLLTIMFISE